MVGRSTSSISSGPQPRRVAVLGTNWIGDAVMSLAGLREIRRILPDARLTLFVRQWVAGLYRNQGLADELASIPSDLSLPKRLIWMARRLEGYELAIVFPNSFASALPTFLAAVPRRLGYATDLRGNLLTHRARPRIKALNRHQVFYYLDLLYQGGISPLNYLEEESFQPDISLQVDLQEVDRVEALIRRLAGGKRPRILMSPGAFFGSAKRWFPDRYASLADRLIQSHAAEIIFIGSPQERDLASHIEGQMRNRPILLSGETSLPQLLALLSTCDLFITNDSGPMHLAAALGTPQIALFGSTDEVATGPFDSRAQVIHKHVACSPCLLRECPIDLRCFERITVDEVISQARLRLS